MLTLVTNMTISNKLVYSKLELIYKNKKKYRSIIYQQIVLILFGNIKCNTVVYRLSSCQLSTPQHFSTNLFLVNLI